MVCNCTEETWRHLLLRSSFDNYPVSDCVLLLNKGHVRRTRYSRRRHRYIRQDRDDCVGLYSPQPSYVVYVDGQSVFIYKAVSRDNALTIEAFYRCMSD